MAKSEVKLKPVCGVSSWNIIGEELGYDWNEICDLMANEELYGEDGSGFWILSDVNSIKNPKLKAIATELLRQSNGKEIIVLDGE